MVKKKSEDIRLNFIGSSAYTVTGSCLEITEPLKQHKFLIECGGCQESNIKDNYDTNARIIYSIDLENTLYCFILHQHVDHVANILGIVNRGFRGKIYATYEAKQMLRHLWEDAAFLHKKDCEQLSNRSKKKTNYQPLYTEQDVSKAMDLVEVIEYDKDYIIEDGNIRFKYLKNNHLVGSASAEFWIKKTNNSVKKIWFTSDLGSSICKNYYVSDLEISHSNNITIIESTYGNKESYNKQDRKKEIKLIEETIREYIVNKKGNILIPVFSMSRLQFMMTLLYELMHNKEEYKNIPVVADTRLGMKITHEYKELLKDKDLELFKSVTEWDQLTQISDYDGTTACILDPSPKIVLSASGFLSNGTHATAYLKRWVSNPNNCVIFCGYCGAEGSLGYRLKENSTKTITIDGSTLIKSCKVITLHTFSSHIQKNELLSLSGQIQTERIILHHGSKEAKQQLANDMKQKLSECGKTTVVVVAERNMILTL